MSIINNEELVEDVIQGIADYLDIDDEHIKHYVDDNMMNDIYEAMWQAEADMIIYHAERIKDGI